MTIILLLFLMLAIAGLGLLAGYTFQLWSRNAQLSADLAHQRANFDGNLKQLQESSSTMKSQYQALVKKYNEDARKWSDYCQGLKTENQRLSKWKNIADADTKAREMAVIARATIEKANADASNILISAQQQVAALRASAEQQVQAQQSIANETATAVAQEAKEKAKLQKDEAQAMLNSATSQAAQIVETANKKAEEIAGSAYEAMKNASLYERTAKAMKNIVEGYGDEYIIPEQSLLDDLAEGFSHAQAGQELKRARECTKIMIRNKTAATCDYVEANRRETAINFVVDAFNGKIDSILSRVKHDNAGKLEQQIRDAFTLVNYNGKPFRDARINEEYLAARLDELKWAEVAQQFALNEREEQRHAKEQAREEARARKEQERALREAAKEEEMLRKAMEQAEEQFAHASGQQKAMYEERLKEMAERLNQAMERKERARSMAEQTKKGHVYVISNIGSLGEDVYKIGLTRRDDPFDRVRELGDSSVPFDFDVHAMILCEDAPAIEHQLHNHFLLRQINKINHRKEFFRATLQEIREEIENLGLTTGVKWTMTAEAKEYRESIAIEQAIKDNPEKREAWMKRQLYLESSTSNDPVEVGSDADDE